jgi:hypothetical protein
MAFNLVKKRPALNAQSSEGERWSSPSDGASARFLRMSIDTLLGGSASYEEVSIQPN